MFHRRAVTIAETLYGPAHIEVARHLSNLASTQVLQNRYAEALPLLDRARAILLEASPGDPELLGYVQLNRADSMRGLGDLNGAEATLASVIEQQPGGSFLALEAQLGTAFVMLSRGNESEGERLYRTTLQALESLLGLNNPYVPFAKEEYERVRALPR